MTSFRVEPTHALRKYLFLCDADFHVRAAEWNCCEKRLRSRDIVQHIISAACNLSLR